MSNPPGNHARWICKGQKVMKFLGMPSSGSIAGTVFSHNRAGQYTRNRRAPVQPIGTGRRAFIRSSFGLSSSGWAALTDLERAAWTAFAKLYPVTDSLGQAITLTGQQMYVRCSVSLLNVNQVAPTNPPTTNAGPDVSTAAVTASVATGIEVDWASGSAGDFVTNAFSQAVSAGRSFWSTFWQPLGSPGYAAANTATNTVTTAVYAAQFGTPVIGDALFTKITPVNSGGFNGTPVIVKTLWVA